MHPDLHINFVAIAGAVAASFVFGWLWFGPLFGRLWARLNSFSADVKPDARVMLRGMGLSILGAFLTAYVLAHTGEVWRPSVWRAGADAPPYVYGFFNAFFTWIGFFVPMLLATVAWEGKSWKLFSLNALYYFLNLQLIAMILAHWR